MVKICFCSVVGIPTLHVHKLKDCTCVPSLNGINCGKERRVAIQYMYKVVLPLGAVYPVRSVVSVLLSGIPT